MKKFIPFVLSTAFMVYSCSESQKTNTTSQSKQSASPTMASSVEQLPQELNGFKTQLELGEFLVATGGCDDCHSPKKMTDIGPVVDSTLRLSGHPSKMPAPEFTGIKEAVAKGYAITQTLTSWVGPWGTSYAANLTPDKTGIGNWSEAQFVKAIREGKYKGMDNTRPIMPPMPWEVIAKMRDFELKAMFAYLKSIKPINNAVPGYQPPATMAKK
jgi:hypothetical protein